MNDSTAPITADYGQVRAWMQRLVSLNIMKTKNKTIKWMGINSKPNEIGFYYVKNLDGSLSMRYWDDSGRNGGYWSFFSNDDGFVPNNSFTEWARIPEIHSS